MKIGLALEKFDPQKGGLEHWTWQFARRLADLGHEVHVIAFEFAKPAVDSRLVVHPVHAAPSRLQRAAALEKKLRSLQLDVIHDMGCGWYADIFHPHGGSTLALWEHNLMRIPRWRQIRFWREKRYRELAEIERRQLACGKAVVVAVSKMVMEHFRTLHGVSPDRMRLIPNGVDTDRFSPRLCGGFREPMRRELGCGEHETLFLMVAHNLLLKNAGAALRALSRLTATGAAARLVILGGKRPARFVRLARQLGLAQRVSFLDAMSDVRLYYAAADVYLHPTWYDPCSLVALEALACGLPVITTRFNGASEIMTDGVHGFLLDDPADAGTLARKMGDLSDPELRARMGAASRRLAEEHTFERQTGEFLSLYREVARA